MQDQENQDPKEEVVEIDAKEELVNSFSPNKSYVGSEIRKRITFAKIKSSKNIEPPKENQNLPTVIKRGDVFTTYQGKKSRPVVVIKKVKDRIAYIPLTSGVNIHSTVIFNSRFYGEGYFTFCVDVCTEEYARNHFIGIFDDRKALREATTVIKNFVNRL